MKIPALPPVGKDDVLFSAKCFVASMLAMYIASCAGLPRPFWSLMTTYIVAAPLAGMVRSKAVFRISGTFVGSMAALVMVPLLVNAPELLSLAIALWVAVCLYLSLLDRTPRAYSFMLAGYTAALVAFPTLNTPSLMFDTAAARVEEIGIGIFSATLVHSLVFPADLSKMVLGIIKRGLTDMHAWAGDILQRQCSAQTMWGDRSRAAADITQLRVLGTHIPFDTSHLSWSAQHIASLQDHLAALTPALSAAEDRLLALEKVEGEVAPDIKALLDRVLEWLSPSHEALKSEELVALRADIASIYQGEYATWSLALRIGLATRLDELVTRWQTCVSHRRNIQEGLRGDALTKAPKRTQGQLLHIDQGMALLSALAAVIATLTCCAFWILTGWSTGSVAAMMAAIFCSLFASLDNPVPAMHSFLKWSAWSIPISAVYVLFLLPLVRDFAMLPLLCAPTFLILGSFAAKPTTAPKAMPLIVNVCTTLAMHDTSQADLVSFVNSTLAQMFGMGVAACTVSLMRSIGASWSAQRIQQATWRDLAELAGKPLTEGSGEAYLSRMLDRIALLAPRVAQSGGTVDGVPTREALRDLRLGADVVTLQRDRRHLPSELIEPTLQALGTWYQSRVRDHELKPPATILGWLDELLLCALAQKNTPQQAVIAALVGLRRNLFPEATMLVAS